MAYDSIVDSAALNAQMTDVANHIRTKGGTTDLLDWPEGFKAAVDAIQTGGGKTADVTITGSNNGDYTVKTLTTYADYVDADGKPQKVSQYIQQDGTATIQATIRTPAIIATRMDVYSRMGNDSATLTATSPNATVTELDRRSIRIPQADHITLVVFFVE